MYMLWGRNLYWFFFECRWSFIFDCNWRQTSTLWLSVWGLGRKEHVIFRVSPNLCIVETICFEFVCTGLLHLICRMAQPQIIKAKSYQKYQRSCYICVVINALLLKKNQQNSANTTITGFWCFEITKHTNRKIKVARISTLIRHPSHTRFIFVYVCFLIILIYPLVFGRVHYILDVCFFVP